MPLDCKTLTVAKPPAIISAIELTLDKNTCDELCDANVTITWKNTGITPGSFKPAIVVNGERTEVPDTTITLTKDQTYSHTFNLTQLVEGVYTICPDPNP